jgi:hypothetical protein
VNKKTKTSTKKGGTPGGPSNNQQATVGEMKFCPLCHGAGFPERVYRSHNLVKCDKKDLFSNQALTTAVKPKPPAGAGRGRGRGQSQMEHNQRERVRHSFEKATSTREQIRRAFRAASSPEEVCQYLRVLDPLLEDT